MTSKIPNAPPDNIFTIDLAPYQAYLVDLPPGATRGMRTEQEGWDSARSEVMANQAKLGDRAGITTTDYNRFVDFDQQHGQILAQLPRVSKAVEVVEESLSHVDNQRHKLVTQFANAAESHAAAEGGNATLTTAYEKTIAYRSIIADKAVKTRQKNEEAKKGPGAPADGPPVAPPGAPPAPPAPPAGPDDAAQGKGGGGGSKMPNAPPDSIFAIDLNPLKPFLVDLPPGATRGMRTAQEGWEAVQEEIVNNQAKYGDRAGITATDYNRFLALNDQYAQLRPQLPLLQKAEEVLVESLAHADNQRHRLVTQFADAAESHAAAEGGDPTLLTAYEKTIAYRGVVAEKAVKTRKKNEEAKKGGSGG